VADWAGTGSLLSPEPFVASRLSLFLAELKRRKVTRAVVAYDIFARLLRMISLAQETRHHIQVTL